MEPAAALVAVGGAADEYLAPSYIAEEAAPLLRQAGRPLAGDDSSFAELSRDRGNDWHRKTGRAAERPGRDRPGPADDADDFAYTRLAFGQPYRPGHLSNDCLAAFFAHDHGPRGTDVIVTCSAWSCRATNRSIRSPGRSPQERRSTFASDRSGQVWMLR